MILMDKQNVMEDEAGEIIPEEICMLYLGTWTLSNKRQGEPMEKIE